MNKRSPDDVDKLVGTRLFQLRKAKGLSQTELGVALGVRFQQVQRYENGINRLSPSRLRKAADVFGVRIEDFFMMAGAGAAVDAPMGFAEPENGADRMLAAFQAIDDDILRDLVVRLLEHLAKR